MDNFSNYKNHQNYFVKTKHILKNKSLIINLIKTTRPHLLVFSVFPILSVVSFIIFNTNITPSVIEVFLIIVSALLAHISVFYYVDYHEYKTGLSFVIGKEVNNIVTLGIVKPLVIRNASIVFLLLSILIGIFLAIHKPATTHVFLFMGLFLSIAYIYSIKKNFLYLVGEASVFLCFGPLLVNGCYYYFTEGYHNLVVLISIIFGLVSLVVFQNNSIENIIYDDQNNKNSLMRSLGFDRGKQFIIFLEVSILFLLISYIYFMHGILVAIMLTPLLTTLFYPVIVNIKTLASPLSSKVLGLKMEMVKLQFFTSAIIIFTSIAERYFK